MVTKQIGNNYIFYDEFIYKKDDKIKKFLDNEFELISSKINKSFILVLGGDGTMLAAIRKHYKKNLVFLGVNFGNKGFLLNEKKIIENCEKYVERKYSLLKVNYELNGMKYSGICFNEANIVVSDGKVLDLLVNIGGKKINLRGDGVLVVTPAGSTAYNKSLLGPVISHKLKSFLLTPKADLNLKRPIVFSDSEKISIKNINRINPFKVYLDGNLLGKKINNLETDIFFSKSKYVVSIAFSSDYLNTWENKIYGA